MLRALLFDYDGTLVLSEPLHYAAFAEVLRRRGVVLTQATYYERYLGWTDAECAHRMVADFRLGGERDAAALLAAKIKAMEARIAAGVPLAPGVEQFVAEAALRHTLAIVSAGLRREIVTVLSRAGLERFFPVLVSAEDVRAGKPDPEGFLLACGLLRESGVVDLRPAECLVVEDSPKGIAAARAAGMPVIALAHTRPGVELADADLVLESFADARWEALEDLFDG